ncbi:ribosome maturation factor RimM [Kocuria sp. M1R5S2]|uniref:ribosome maturation factor RimM n=1 Tax=Kocuria rhizosphaerae TaxID=3376285 RepID=UPI0037B1B992
MKVQVARIGKPHGIRGEVTVQLFTDVPEERFAPGTRLIVEPPTPLAPEGELTVRRARWNKSVLVVALEEVPDRNAAERLRGARLLAEAQDEDDEGDEWYEHELVDLEVRTGPADGSGPRIGVVTGLRTQPVQDLLEVELDDGRREALLPFVEEIVPVVDPEGGFVVVTPPPGLLELGLPDEVPAAGTRGEGIPGAGPEDGR